MYLQGKERKVYKMKKWFYKVNFYLNNYQIGSVIKQTRTDKIISKERINSKCTIVTYDDLTLAEVQFAEKVFTKKANVLGMKRKEIEEVERRFNT